MRLRTHCPSCMSSALMPVCTLPYSSPAIQRYLRRQYQGRASGAFDLSDYELVRCSDCDLAFQMQVPSEFMLDEIYNAWIPGAGPDVVRSNYGLPDYRDLAEQVQFILAHFKLAPANLNLLEFGFGWGEWARMAMAFGCNVSGIELSKERIAHAQAIGIEVLDLNQLPPQHFHFINTEQVFELLTDPLLVLEKLVRALAVNGMIRINVPNAENALTQLNRTKDIDALTTEHQMAVAPIEHLNSFTHSSLVRFASSLGLKPIRPSFYLLLNSASGLLSINNLLRVVVRPFYRYVYPRSTCMYFVRAQ